MRRLGLGLGISAQRASGGGAPTVPATITSGQWTLADSPSAGGNTLTVNLISAPSNGGSAVTSYEYRRNGGSWTTLSGGTALGARAITVLATTLASIEIRAVNAIGGGAASDTKSATPTVASGLVIASSLPADNATGVLNTINPQITFSAPVVAGTGLITLRQNISGTWSDLETFDMATEVVLATDAAGAAAGQVFFMGSTIQINPSTILVEGREYAIRIAATAIDDISANSFAGIADDTTLSFTTAAVPQVARFGDSTNNASGTGSFDTNLYTGAPPANITVGAFTVTAGVISCNGSQTVGSYTVGGYPVEVIAGYKAIANQSEHNALSGASDLGKTILIREAANVLWNNTTAGYGRRQNLNGGIHLGDGPDPRLNKWNTSYDSRKHYDRMSLAVMRNFTFRSLRIVPSTKSKAFDFTSASFGAIITGDFVLDKNLIVASRPDPNGDYSGGVSTYPGGFGIYYTAAVTGSTCTDNVTIGAERGYRWQPLGYLENIGNESWLGYEDAFTITSNGCPTLNGGFLAGAGLGRPAPLDVGDPHGDGIQILPGASHENHVVEASASFSGDHRARGKNQPFFLWNTSVGYLTHMRDCVSSDDSIYPFSIQSSRGSVMEHLAWAPTPYGSLPTSTTNGTRFGVETPFVSGTNLLSDSVLLTGGTVNVGVTQSGNVVPTAYVAGDWDAMYENWTVDSEQYPTLQKIMTDLKTKASGPGSGKGHRVTFSGPENSDYVIDGGSLTTPTLSGFTVTSTVAATVTAEIDTDVPLNPIFWAIVPLGQAVSSARDIKRRKVTNGILWGFTSVGNDTLTNIALNCAGAGLVAATQYDIVAMQENGWTKVSSVSRVTFTAT